MQLPEMDLLLKKMSFSSCSDDDEYEKQCWCPAVYSDSTDTSFLDYL